MNFLRKYISIIIVVLIPIIIEERSLIKFSEWIWVNPIAQHVLDNTLISILLIGLISYLYYVNFFERKSKSILTFLLVVILIIAKTWTYWEFKGPYWLIPFILLLIYLISEWKSTNKTKNLHKEDNLNRVIFADSIIEDIKSKNNPEHSYNYGLVGEWGSGKTFLMEIIYQKMQEDDSFVAFYFKPWEVPNEKDFSYQILNGIKSKSGNYELENKINKFLTKIETDSADILTKTFTSILAWLISGDSNLDEIKIDLSKYLKDKEKRLVVFLDDLDRLDVSEIKELLRLMRNTLDIPYLFFIVGFDRSYISKTIGYEGIEFDNYISKFFQVISNIPLANKNDLFEKYFKEKIFKILPSKLTDEDAKYNFKLLVSEEFINLIQTPRQFENITDSFGLVYKNLKLNCDWFTLFQLEILRHTNYSYYEFIRKNGVTIVENIDSLIEKNKVDEKIKPFLLGIQRISQTTGSYPFWDIKYFNKYFSLVNSSYEIDITEFNYIMTKSKHQITDHILIWIGNGKYNDLDGKLSRYLQNTSDIDSEILFVIDNSMSFGPNRRRYIYDPVIKYLIDQFTVNETNTLTVISQIKGLLTEDNISRCIGYYFLSKDIVTIIADIETRFDALLGKNSLPNQEVYWFINHVYIWVNGLFHNNYNLLPSDILENNRGKINELINKKLKNFAQNNIKDFLINFICPLRSSSNVPNFVFYNNYVPKIITVEESLEILRKVPTDGVIDELIKFLETPPRIFDESIIYEYEFSNIEIFFKD